MNQVTHEDVLKALEEIPELKRFHERTILVDDLAKGAAAETDLGLMADSFDMILRMKDRLNADMLNYYINKSKEQINCTDQQFYSMAKNCKGWKKIAEELEEVLKQERKENNEMFDHMCFLMMMNPRKTFEDIILRQVERRERIESVDGDLSWGLKFPLKARLKMAWKLAFGSKEAIGNV